MSLMIPYPVCLRIGSSHRAGAQFDYKLSTGCQNNIFSGHFLLFCKKSCCII